MNYRKGLVSGKTYECKSDYDNVPNSWEMQYGIEKDISGVWKDIINTSSFLDAKTQIDDLLDRMENNSETNGFLGEKQDIHTDALNGFRLDDRDIYYMFFDQLKQCQEKAIQSGKPIPDGNIIFVAIRNTIQNYLGAPSNNARNIRRALTDVEYIDDDDFVLPSIKKQKGQHCGLCTEMSAIAHNLWLLTGRESSFVTTKDCAINGVDQQFARDGHTFCMVNTGSHYKLCDFALNKFDNIPFNPIESLKNNEPLCFGDYIYTDASIVKDNDKHCKRQ